MQMTKIVIYCPQGSGTLRQQLTILHMLHMLHILHLLYILHILNSVEQGLQFEGIVVFDLLFFILLIFRQLWLSCRG